MAGLLKKKEQATQKGDWDQGPQTYRKSRATSAEKGRQRGRTGKGRGSLSPALWRNATKRRKRGEGSSFLICFFRRGGTVWEETMTGRADHEGKKEIRSLS